MNQAERIESYLKTMLKEPLGEPLVEFKEIAHTLQRGGVAITRTLTVETTEVTV